MLQNESLLADWEERNLMINPGKLRSLLEGNEAVNLQILSWTNSINDELQLRCSDGKFVTWKVFIDNRKEEIKNIANRQGIIKITESRIIKGIDLHILNFEILKET